MRITVFEFWDNCQYDLQTLELVLISPVMRASSSAKCNRWYEKEMFKFFPVPESPLSN